MLADHEQLSLCSDTQTQLLELSLSAAALDPNVKHLLLT